MRRSDQGRAIVPRQTLGILCQAGNTSNRRPSPVRRGSAPSSFLAERDFTGSHRPSSSCGTLAYFSSTPRGDVPRELPRYNEATGNPICRRQRHIVSKPEQLLGAPSTRYSSLVIIYGFSGIPESHGLSRRDDRLRFRT